MTHAARTSTAERQAQRDEAMREADLVTLRNCQPYCDECGEPIAPTPHRSISGWLRCVACRDSTDC